MKTTSNVAVFIILFVLSLVTARAADQGKLQPWSYGPYDKLIEPKRPGEPSATRVSAVAHTRSADEVLILAKAEALSGNKAIFVHFGASWCGWCRKLDAFLERPDIKPVFEKYFVPVKLVVQENEKNKALENPGADAFLQKLGGPAGLPYFAFLDAQGALIVNSRHPSTVREDGENIGFPAQPGEIDWFIQMMKKATPKISDGEVKSIETVLRQSAKP